MRRRRSIFDIMREYMEEFEQVAEEFFESLHEEPTWDVKSCCLKPLFNVSVGPDRVIVTADLPYANPESIRINEVREDLIEICADMRVKVNFENFGITHRKGEFSSFRCQVPIPVPVDTSRAKTQFTQGILEIILPRKKGYTIKIE